MSCVYTVKPSLAGTNSLVKTWALSAGIIFCAVAFVLVLWLSQLNQIPVESGGKGLILGRVVTSYSLLEESYVVDIGSGYVTAEMKDVALPREKIVLMKGTFTAGGKNPVLLVKKHWKL